MKLSYNDCHFGTDCFKKVTKMKSHTVLQILRLGYRVLFSDVDVYWFENPIQYMMSYGPRAVVAQSDEWNVTGNSFTLDCCLASRLSILLSKLLCELFPT